MPLLGARFEKKIVCSTAQELEDILGTLVGGCGPDPIYKIRYCKLCLFIYLRSDPEMSIMTVL